MARTPASEIGLLRLELERTTLDPLPIGPGTNTATGGEPVLLDVNNVTTTRLLTTDGESGTLCFAKDTGEVYTYASHTARWQPIVARPCIAIQGGWTKTFADNSESTDDIEGTAQYLDQMSGNYTAVDRAVSDVTLVSGEHGVFMVQLCLRIEDAAGMDLRVKLYDATAGADMATAEVEGREVSLIHTWVKSSGTAQKLQVKVLQDNTDTADCDPELWSFVLVRLGSVDPSPLTSTYGGSLPTFITGP